MPKHLLPNGGEWWWWIPWDRIRKNNQPKNKSKYLGDENQSWFLTIFSQMVGNAGDESYGIESEKQKIQSKIHALGILAHLLRMVSWNLDTLRFVSVIVHPNRSSSDVRWARIPRDGTYGWISPTCPTASPTHFNKILLPRFSQDAIIRPIIENHGRTGGFIYGLTNSSEICKIILCTPGPKHSMYGLCTYIYHTNQPNEGKCTIHWSYG